MLDNIKNYYRLTKPGIIYGNLFTTAASFLYASYWHFTGELLAATMFGLGFVIASACIFNNYMDRDIDRKMARTKDRALVTGVILADRAIAFALALGLVGIFLLLRFVNLLSAEIALAGFVFYVFVYGYAKRKSPLGTPVGSISGAVPILVGYTAIMNQLTAEGWILFGILALWQMPHFYAIALYRLNDYAAAEIPVLPLVKGHAAAKMHSMVFIILFAAAVPLLTFFGHAGLIYLAVMTIVTIIWLSKAMKGFSYTEKNQEKWAKNLFFFSLIVLVVFSVTLALSPFLF